MTSFPVPDEYKIVRHVQSVRTYVTELDQSNTPIVLNRPYSRRGHDEQKARLGWQIYRKFARQYVNRDVTYLLLNVPVT